MGVVKNKRDIELNRRIAELRREASNKRRELERERLKAFELETQLKETQEQIQILTVEHGFLKSTHATAEEQVKDLLIKVLFIELSIHQLETRGWKYKYTKQGAII